MTQRRSSARATDGWWATGARRAVGPAVALVWVLAGPPIENGAPVLDAPQDAWRQYGHFKTEGECLRAKEFMKRVTGVGKYEWEAAYWDRLARCASRDE
jgi:hypothetical protein